MFLLVLLALPPLEEEVLFFLDMDLERNFLGLGRLTGALGGSRVSSITKTTPSSVSELLFFDLASLSVAMVVVAVVQVVVLAFSDGGVIKATSVIGVTSSLEEKNNFKNNEKKLLECQCKTEFSLIN